MNAVYHMNYIFYILLTYKQEQLKDLETKKSLKIKTGITSHLKIDVPTFSEKQLPSSLKLIPITTPGSRFIK